MFPSLPPRYVGVRFAPRYNSKKFVEWSTRMQRVQVRVYGKVQGVGFRHRIQTHAQAIGLAGWVRNHPERRDLVEMEIEAAEPLVRDFLRWLPTLPSPVRVDEVCSEVMAPRGEAEFFIRR